MMVNLVADKVLDCSGLLCQRPLPQIPRSGTRRRDFLFVGVGNVVAKRAGSGPAFLPTRFLRLVVDRSSCHRCPDQLSPVRLDLPRCRSTIAWLTASWISTTRAPNWPFWLSARA